MELPVLLQLSDTQCIHRRPIGYGVGLRIKRSSVRIRPWPLRWVLGQGSLLPLSQGEAFTLASISYLAILVKYILVKKKKKKKKRNLLWEKTFFNFFQDEQAPGEYVQSELKGPSDHAEEDLADAEADALVNWSQQLDVSESDDDDIWMVLFTWKRKLLKIQILQRTLEIDFLIINCLDMTWT